MAQGLIALSGPLRTLVQRLTERGVKVGIATSVGKAEWEAARLYPGPSVPAEVAEVLGLFGAE